MNLYCSDCYIALSFWKKLRSIYGALLHSSSTKDIICIRKMPESPGTFLHHLGVDVVRFDTKNKIESTSPQRFGLVWFGLVWI